MNNYKLIIQYDGTNYCGWQIQENVVTVQQKIRDSINLLLKEEINLIGSGRTDTGVHALGQVANFQTEQEIDLYKLIYSMNSILPNDISIVDGEKVDAEFHSRFSAKKRSYIYLLSHKKSPFYKSYSLHYPNLNPEQISNLNSLSKVLFGEHDFTSFSKKNTEIENKICTIHSIHWRSTGSFTVFYVEANRFLHGMVKTFVGTILHAEKNNFEGDYLKEILAKKDRAAAGEAVISKGLFLYKVRY